MATPNIMPNRQEVSKTPYDFDGFVRRAVPGDAREPGKGGSQDRGD
jgi:hypothetical protein